MKVLSVVAGLDPARGGSATAATNMLLAAQQAGVESVVVVPQHAGIDGAPSQGLITLLTPSGVVVHLMPTVRWPRSQAYRWGISPVQIAWIMRHVSAFDAVHVHGVWGLSSVGGSVIARMAHKPLIVTAHESLTAFDIDGSRSRARRRQKLLLKSLYVRAATLFVLTSDLEARTSLPTTAPRRIIHYPVVDTGAGIPPLRVRGQQHELRVGFLGRIDPKKNLDLLIKAMAALPSHVRLIIAGTGSPDIVAALHQQAAHLGLKDRLEWRGFVEPQARSAFLANLDVLAMPSEFESFGLSAAEGMLHGVPVLVTAQTGIAEVIERHGGGRIVRADATAIASTIAELDADRANLAVMGAGGQTAVVEELSSARIGRALRDAYADAVEVHSSGTQSTALARSTSQVVDESACGVNVCTPCHETSNVGASPQETNYGMPTILNLGCGTKTHADCVNIDWSIYARIKHHPFASLAAPLIFNGNRLRQFQALADNVVVHDLRRGIPLADRSADAVYHSHVLEHIDRERVPAFLLEVARVLKPGGVHRIVVPDLERYAREYLASVEAGLTDPTARKHHDDTVSQMLLQIVRREAHGTSLQHPLRRRVENLVLGDARKRGETHRWMWDRVNLPHALEEAGFRDIRLVDWQTSRIHNWNHMALDQTGAGAEYKPESLYVEALR